MVSAAILDLGSRVVIWALDDFRPSVPWEAWLVGLGPFVVLWILAIPSRPASASGSSSLLELRALTGRTDPKALFDAGPAAGPIRLRLVALRSPPPDAPRGAQSGAR